MEDQLFIQRILANQLEKKGMQVFRANNGKEGFNIFKVIFCYFDKLFNRMQMQIISI